MVRWQLSKLLQAQSLSGADEDADDGGGDSDDDRKTISNT